MAQIDQDGSGTVDRLEWISYLVSPAGEGTDYFDFQAKKMFDVFDVNKDGMIDDEEFSMILLDRFGSHLCHLKEDDRATGEILIQCLASEMF